MKIGVWSFIVLILAAVPGCGVSASGICDAVCDCQGCSDAEHDSCVDDYEDVERAAEHEGCSDQVDEYFACVDDEIACDNGQVDLDGCGFEEESLGDCLN